MARLGRLATAIAFLCAISVQIGAQNRDWLVLPVAPADSIPGGLGSSWEVEAWVYNGNVDPAVLLLAPARVECAVITIPPGAAIKLPARELGSPILAQPLIMTTDSVLDKPLEVQLHTTLLSGEKDREETAIPVAEAADGVTASEFCEAAPSRSLLYHSWTRPARFSIPRRFQADSASISAESSEIADGTDGRWGQSFGVPLLVSSNPSHGNLARRVYEE